MNNAEFRAYTQHTEELSKMIIENNKAQAKLETIKEVAKTCVNNDFELCCTCKYADKCRDSVDDYSSYNVAKYILKIIGG